MQKLVLFAPAACKVMGTHQQHAAQLLCTQAPQLRRRRAQSGQSVGCRARQHLAACTGSRCFCGGKICQAEVWTGLTVPGMQEVGSCTSSHSLEVRVHCHSQAHQFLQINY